MLMTGPWNIFRMTPLISLWDNILVILVLASIVFSNSGWDFSHFLERGMIFNWNLDILGIMRLSLKIFIYLVSNFWLLWVFVAAQEFSLVAASRGYFLGVEQGF